eukprot:2631193-Pleurochrysis_carterae.AAC.2
MQPKRQTNTFWIVHRVCLPLGLPGGLLLRSAPSATCFELSTRSPLHAADPYRSSYTCPFRSVLTFGDGAPICRTEEERVDVGRIAVQHKWPRVEHGRRQWGECVVFAEQRFVKEEPQIAQDLVLLHVPPKGAAAEQLRVEGSE